MARWDNEPLMFESSSNKACKGCALAMEGEMGYLKSKCEIYGPLIVKPPSIAFDGKPCEYFKAAE